ncbi:hypothetical protein FKM82_023589 [Ascaphus truei]
MTSRSRDRGYSNSIIGRGRSKTKNRSRISLLTVTVDDTQKKKTTDTTICFIGTYDRNWRKYREAIQKHWHILTTDADLKQVLGERVHLVSRRAPNLGDKLVNSHYIPSRSCTFLTREQLKGFTPCRSCSACPYMQASKEFYDSRGLTKSEIRSALNCKFEAVIYYLKCPCPMIYIGMTTRELRFRVLEHVPNIKNSDHDFQSGCKLTTVARHFRLKHNSNIDLLKVFNIDQVILGIRGGDLERSLLQRECRWIVKLGTLLSLGMNEYMGFAMFL